MTLSQLLEDFEQHRTGTTIAVTDVMFEDQKLESFEKGYQAGWEDCARSQNESETRISEDLARNIHDLSFTYDEAQTGFLAAMEPLIKQMVDAVLPVLAHDSLGLRVVEILQAEVSAHGRQPVVLTTAPGSAPALRAILPEEDSFPIEIEEETTFAEGQIQLRFGTLSEREIDLGQVLDGIGAAVEGFFHEAPNSLKEIT